MKPYIKRFCLVMTDLVIAIYLGFAMLSWNIPIETTLVCTKVDINMEDENSDGFLDAKEIKVILEKANLYPVNKKVSDINTRAIEETLCNAPFIRTAQCYVTESGHVVIGITQRTPVIRVKSDNRQDYYIDDNGGVMPNSQYTSDLIIVTGNITQNYARYCILPLAQAIMDSKLWSNQIEQINVLSDHTIELIPRVGDHIINIGMIPYIKDKAKMRESITEFTNKQLQRLENFYKYGLSEAGWNKYSYISLEFSNQVICTHRDGQEHEVANPIPLADQSQSELHDQKAPGQEEIEKKEKEEKEKKEKEEKEKKEQEEKEKKEEKDKATKSKKPSNSKANAPKAKSQKTKS